VVKPHVGPGASLSELAGDYVSWPLRVKPDVALMWAVEMCILSREVCKDNKEVLDQCDKLPS
jgi:hypothetical protein